MTQRWMTQVGRVRVIDRIGKRVPTGADTRLITPYTGYLLRGLL